MIHWLHNHMMYGVIHSVIPSHIFNIPELNTIEHRKARVYQNLWNLTTWNACNSTNQILNITMEYAISITISMHHMNTPFEPAEMHSSWCYHALLKLNNVRPTIWNLTWRQTERRLALAPPDVKVRRTLETRWREAPPSRPTTDPMTAADERQVAENRSLISLLQ